MLQEYVFTIQSTSTSLPPPIKKQNLPTLKVLNFIATFKIKDFRIHHLDNKRDLKWMALRP